MIVERKRTHYKLYKAKKQWMTACSILVVGAGLAMANSTVAHADTITDANNSESTQSTETAPGTDVFSQQVTLSSTDKADDDNTVVANPK